MSHCVIPTLTYESASTVCTPAYPPPIYAFLGFFDAIAAFFADAHSSESYQALSREEEEELFGEVLSEEEEAEGSDPLCRNVSPSTVATSSEFQDEHGVLSRAIAVPTLWAPVVETASSQNVHRSTQENFIQPQAEYIYSSHRDPRHLPDPSSATRNLLNTQMPVLRGKAPSKIREHPQKITQQVLAPEPSGLSTMFSQRQEALGVEPARQTSVLKRKAEDPEPTSRKKQNRAKPTRGKFAAGIAEKIDLVWTPLHVDKRVIQNSPSDLDTSILDNAPTFNSTFHEIPRTISPIPQRTQNLSTNRPAISGTAYQWLGPDYEEEARGRSFCGNPRAQLTELEIMGIW
ncbi:hypothetical protein JR316_0002736 [Psilocybe cubensis]|uniref:Uncharacterized protein n=2 Tax=Psilocybe cubensis TaxID=181762 RepID=A0ACB8HD69_PSICU|nr:hypothetical protein JR316_0002736 [Psilocybe cubensis]KAH9485821.1 hypothetical protein JR316_0002736 [Psilocybe cubensis]